MAADLVPATASDQTVIQQMARFYVYELSRFLGWPCPADGAYECRDLREYWSDGRHPFLIKDGDELAGFALIDERGAHAGVRWNVGEFFVVAKFARRGVGRRVATALFDRFRGVWNVMQLPRNAAALAFWRAVVAGYTGGRHRQYVADAGHQRGDMNILEFDSRLPPRARQVRRATADDHRAIAGLFHDTIHAVNAVDYTHDQLAAWAPPVDDAVLARWHQRVAAKLPWVVEVDGAIVGFAELHPDGHIDCFYVDHRHQRSGIGSTLMTQVVSEARRLGLLRLSVEASITARPFFAAHGFIQVRPNLVHRGGLSLTNYVMERRL